MTYAPRHLTSVMAGALRAPISRAGVLGQQAAILQIEALFRS
jgi:hypothetical protein